MSGAGSPASADVAAIGDALLRFAAGTDTGDAALIASAFAPDAVVDFGPCGDKLGLAFPPLEGRDDIVGFLAGTSRHQITSHVVTNVRLSTTARGTRSQALVEATHIVRHDPARRFRMLDRYEADHAPHDGEWRIERLVIDNVWFEGDPRIMLCR